MPSKKVILDTNAVLRFIVGDKPDKQLTVAELISSNDCIIPIEVIAEAVYNLEKYYNHTRQLIAEEVKDFIAVKEDLFFEENVVKFGCKTFASTKLDFIDCLLIGYANIKGNPVFSFDDPLNKQLANNTFNKPR